MKTINVGTTDVAATFDKILVLSDAPKIAVQGIATGAPSSVIIDIEGSLDGTSFGLIETHTFTADELTALSAYFYITDKPVPYFRVKVNTLTIIERVVEDVTADAGNTGNGTLTTPTAVDSAPIETWTLTCTTGGPTGIFSVTGSVSGAKAGATSETPYDNTIVAFTITDGATDWIIGDIITFDVNIDGGLTTLVRFE